MNRRPSVLGEVAHRPADTAGHGGLPDAQAPERRVQPTTGASEVNAAAPIAAPSIGVVLREAPGLVLRLVALRSQLLNLRAQTFVLALQRPDLVSQKGQALAENRRRAALVDQRLNFIQQRLKHFILQGVAGAFDRTGSLQ